MDNLNDYYDIKKRISLSQIKPFGGIIADELDISLSYVSLVLKGERTSPRVRQAIANKLNIGIYGVLPEEQAEEKQ